MRNIDVVVSDTFIFLGTNLILGEFGSDLSGSQNFIDVNLETSSSVTPVTNGNNSEENSDTRVRE